MVLWKLGPRVHTEHVLVSAVCSPFLRRKTLVSLMNQEAKLASSRQLPRKKACPVSGLWASFWTLLSVSLTRHVLTLLPAQTVGLWSFPPSPDCSPCWAL